MNFTRRLTLALLLLRCGASALCQAVHPVQVTTQLVPPYSVYLGDYAGGGNEKLRVVVLQRDLSRETYRIRLSLQVQLDGRTVLQTSRAFQPPPLTLEPGVPAILSGADIAPYLDSRNLDFTGLDRNQYERTRALPEGGYTLCFTAYDYRRQEVPVSATGCSFYFLARNEPPLLNLPACGTRVASRDPAPQQVFFSWMPRGTASPDPAATTEYEFELFEIRFKGRDINNIVQTTRPVFRTRTDFTQLVYGPAEPPLLDSMQYAWRVRAVDKDGRDAFRNNGCSEVCSFTYGGLRPAFTVGMVRDFRVEAQTHRRAQMGWTLDAKQFEGYRVEYKRKGEGYQWNQSEVKDSSSLKVFDLEGDSEYEARVQGYKQGYHGLWSEIVSFRTPRPRVIQCGDPTDRNAQPQGEPLLSGLVRGTTITARGLEITLTHINSTGTDGWYKGEGWVSVPFLANASFGVEFGNIFINTDREVTRGGIVFMSQPIDEWVDQTVARQEENQQLREQRQANREQWQDVEFDEHITLYDQTDIESVQMAADGTVTLTDQAGKQYTAAAKDIPQPLTKSLIIEDKNGDQWVINKNGKVTAVPGGGLPDLKETLRATLANLGLDGLLNRLKIAIAKRDTSEITNAIKEFEPELQTFFAQNPQIGDSARQALQDVFMQFKANAQGLVADASDDPTRWAWLETARKKAENIYQSYQKILQATLQWVASYPCLNQGLQKAEADYEYRSSTSMPSENFTLSALAGLVATGKCLTAKDPQGTDWKNFGLGFTNALITQVDMFSLDIEIAKLLRDEKNWQLVWDMLVRQYNCYKRIPTYTLAITGRTQIEQLLQHLECTSGLSREEMLQISALIYTYLEQHIGDAYFYGQVAGFLVTLPLLVKKLPALARFLRVEQLLQALSRYAKLSGENLAKLRQWLDDILDKRFPRRFLSHDEIQKANFELIADLKARNPKLSNKDIMDLAEKDLLAPEYPFGYTAEKFSDAQKYIKDHLKTIGITDAEGFATGSRITGVTTNPKKSTFGQMKESFTGADLDITLITTQTKLTTGQMNNLMSQFQAKFKHPIGIRYLHGSEKNQLNFIPIYGKIDLILK